jgi:outer membrane protein assembly factor BamB
VWVNPTDASIWVYVTNLSSTLAAYKVAVSAGVPSLAKQWTSAFGAGTSPIVANGTMYYQSLFGNNVIALDASTGALIWQSTSTLSGVHWQSPILVNGRIYAIDDGGHLWAFELDGLFKNGFQ